MKLSYSAALANHSADCMCVPCMKADMDATLRAAGIDPTKYDDGNNGPDSAVRTRYAKPGQRVGNGIVRKLSDKQVSFIKHLMLERDTRNLVRLPGSEDIENMSLRGASDLIERLLACPELPKEKRTVPMASEAQVKFIAPLVAQRDTSNLIVPEDLNTITKAEASPLIDALKNAPYKPKQAKAEVTDGMYLMGERVIKVQVAKQGSGNLYAKELVNGNFTYVPGLIRKLTPEMKMTLEQAKEYGKLYGICCVCSRDLTDEDSIEAGIGPICASKF